MRGLRRHTPATVADVDPALIGVVGVASGVVLSTGGQILVDGLRSRRERDAQEKQDARELRQSVRLVTEELAEAKRMIEKAAKARRYWPSPRMMPTDTWNRHRSDIAAAIESPLYWRFITAAYDAVNELNWTVQHRRNTTTLVDDHRLGAHVEAADNTRETWRTVRQAIQALEETINVQGPASRILREAEDAEREYWPFGDGNDFNLDGALQAEADAAADEGY